jgi:hypothetical protein
MTEATHTDPHLVEMERQDAEAYARQPQDMDEILAWGSIQDWGDACAALAADILTRRKGKPLDIDALPQADHVDLEARDEDIIKGAASRGW